MSEKTKAGHKMGKHRGYDLLSDGRIRPAPGYIDDFKKLGSERHGINDLMKLFSSHCADLLAEINRRQQRLWDEICEDYGLDVKKDEISFDGEFLVTCPKPVDKPEPETTV